MIKTSPLDVSGFLDFWCRNGSPAHLLLAVSGGSDSLALLRLAVLARARGGFEISAGTVNHHLRLGAAHEARMVKGWCEAQGVAHHTLDWRAKKPTTGIQAAARRARYRLLIDLALQKNCSAIMTGHTQDDLAETIFMRQQRTSTDRSLASMLRKFDVANGASNTLPLLRPLLMSRRQGLRDGLDALDQPFIDDPSNRDEQFERVRVRILLADGSADIGHDALVATALRAAQAAKAASVAETARFAELHGLFLPWGGVKLALDGATLVPTDAGLFARLIQAVSAIDHRPSQKDAWAAIEKIARVERASLGGAIVHRKRDHIWIYREPSALHGRAGVPCQPVRSLEPNARILWDKRFVIRNNHDHAVGVGALRSPEIDGPFDGPNQAKSSIPVASFGERKHETPMKSNGCVFRSLVGERFNDTVIRF